MTDKQDVDFGIFLVSDCVIKKETQSMHLFCKNNN